MSVCNNCKSTSFVRDKENGHLMCKTCGVIMKKCKNCGTSSKFVNERVTDDWICTHCGVVATGWWDPGQTNLNFRKQEFGVCDSSEDQMVKTGFYRLMVKADPKEERDRVRKKIIKDNCYEMGVPTAIQDRALLLYENHKGELSKLRPIKKMLLACIIVASRSSDGYFFPMSRVRNLLAEESVGIDKCCLEICSIVGLNQKTFNIKCVPYVVSNLCLPFSCESKIVEYFDKMSIIAPEMAPETRIGVAACRLLKEHDMEIKYDRVAFLCDTAETSIRSFIDRNSKRKRKRHAN